jgi:hypothetical protein
MSHIYKLGLLVSSNLLCSHTSQRKAGSPATSGLAADTAHVAKPNTKRATVAECHPTQPTAGITWGLHHISGSKKTPHGGGARSSCGAHHA